MKYIIAALILWLSTNSKAQTAGTPSADEERIKGVLTSFTDAWNKHDSKAFANVFTEDADLTNVAGRSAKGRGEIERFHAPGFAAKWKDSNQKITQSKIRFIKPDVAAVDAFWEMTGIKDTEGKDMPPRKGLLNFIMTKNGDTWLIAVMHNMDIRETP